MDQPLCGTEITAKKLESLTHQCSNFQTHKISSIEANLADNISGVLSKILRIFVVWTPLTPSIHTTPPNGFVVKIFGDNFPANVSKSLGLNKSTGHDEEISFMHEVECNFYDLKELHDSIPLPICYAKQRNTSSEPGYLVFEDLGNKGGILPPKMYGIGLTKPQLENLLQTVTSVHAWSINTSVDWRSKFTTMSEFKSYQIFIENIIDSFPETKKAHPEIFHDFEYGTLKKIVNRNTFLEIFSGDPMTRYGLPSVLVHGDCTITNMFFEKRDNEFGDKLVALLDWQMVHVGCGVEDLAKMASRSLSTETRRDWTDWMLQRYVELFNAKITNAENGITLINVKKAFDELFAYYAMIHSCNFPIMVSLACKANDRASEEEMAVMKERLSSYHVENFKDARRHFGV